MMPGGAGRLFAIGKVYCQLRHQCLADNITSRPHVIYFLIPEIAGSLQTPARWWISRCLLRFLKKKPQRYAAAKQLLLSFYPT
jgi:hypothetical protein